MADQQFTNPEEIWKAVPGFPGYEVSDYGRVRSFWRRIRKSQGYGVDFILDGRPQKVLKGQPDKNGYDRITLYKNSQRVHRLMLLAFVGPCPPGMEACHDDGKPANRKLDNLRWDTPQNNQGDRKKHGTAPIGTQNGRAKLTPSQVIEIRQMASHGQSFAALAIRFSVYRSTIRKIVDRKLWRHVP